MKPVAVMLCVIVVLPGTVTTALAQRDVEFVTPDAKGVVRGPALAASPMRGATTVTGTATLAVTDPGKFAEDTLNVRLFGVQPISPTSTMVCRDADGADRPCADAAVRALRDRIDEKPVRCEVRDDHDEHGVPWATCFAADGRNLNAWLIRHGYGFTDPRNGKRYLIHETLAQAEGAGLWLFSAPRTPTQARHNTGATHTKPAAVPQRPAPTSAPAPAQTQTPTLESAPASASTPASASAPTQTPIAEPSPPPSKEPR